MDLFEYVAESKKEKEAPLTARMRPQTLDEVVGQENIVGKDKLLYRAIKADRISSVIFYGPPGVGKTTLARVIANTTSADFHQVNATIAGKKDLEEVVAKAKENLGGYGRKTILFIDEIHRFNKAQQDYLLPYVEDGTVILIGATTENPYFEVNGALLSRSRIFELKPLSKENILTLIHRAFKSESGDNHYDTIAAFIESMCGSDPDAALYYLARMLEAGEDVKYIARRMLVAASEEVGNADPMAICVAASAAIGVERVGMPEGRIILAQAASYIASAPKSNSADLGIEKALSLVRKTGNLPIPSYLQDSSYKGAKKLGRGVGYKYAHNFPNHWVEQQYLPDEIRNEQIYEPNDIGHETDIKAYFRKIGKEPERYAYVDPSLSGKPEKPWED
ncbi:MAG: replication-associated recombination protein A [Eubacterium sp.]|nr:replication-associated recombination protein A [Eubacterium sp.]